MTGRLIGGVLSAVTLYAVTLFLPTWLLTESLIWPRGWIFIGLIAAHYTGTGWWLLKHDPALLRERTTLAKDQTLAGKLASLILVALLVVWLVMIPLDVHHWQLIPPPPAGVTIAGGLALLLTGTAIILMTFRANTFAAPVVKLQEDRGQRVIDTGPYAYVRHPLYAGIIPFLAGIAFFLESTAMALAAIPLVVVGTWPRIRTEEATLVKELPGYADYAKRVRWRLCPGVM